MKKTCIVFLLTLVFALNVFSQIKNDESNAALKNATIKVTFLDLPGVNLEKSKWEFAFELRIANQKELSDASVNGRLNLDDSSKLGEFVAKDSFVKNILSKEENRQVRVTIPLDRQTQDKLAADIENQNQFEKLAAQDKITPESSAERRVKTQNFLMYGNILIYDAKLKKNIILPFNWVLPYTRFAHLPGANFEMTFEIKEGGDFAKSVVLPERSKKSMTITTKN